MCRGNFAVRKAETLLQSGELSRHSCITLTIYATEGSTQWFENKPNPPASRRYENIATGVSFI